jgi:hypothetical protein
MLKFAFNAQDFESNYGSVTCMNNENICSNIWDA